MMISFVILEIYFFIILIADMLFIYLICIREPESRKLYRLSLLFVGRFGAFCAWLTTSLRSAYLSDYQSPGVKLASFQTGDACQKFVYFAVAGTIKYLVEIYWWGAPLVLILRGKEEPLTDTSGQHTKSLPLSSWPACPSLSLKQDVEMLSAKCLCRGNWAVSASKKKN